MEHGGDDSQVFLINCVTFDSISVGDDAPWVQPPPATIDFEIAPSSNVLQYVDHGGFNTGYGSGVEDIGKLEKMVEVGRRHIRTMYTYRSVSKAIPMVTGNDDANKHAIHEATFEVLRPEIAKLREVCTSGTEVIL
jgi:cytoplasmic FMR1 interacting protein